MVHTKNMHTHPLNIRINPHHKCTKIQPKKKKFIKKKSTQRTWMATYKNIRTSMQIQATNPFPPQDNEVLKKGQSTCNGSSFLFCYLMLIIFLMKVF